VDKKTKIGAIVGLVVVAVVGMTVLLYWLKAKPADTEQQNQLIADQEFYQSLQESPDASLTSEPLSAVLPQDKQTALPGSSQGNPAAFPVPDSDALSSPVAATGEPADSDFIFETAPQDAGSGTAAVAPFAPASPEGMPPISDSSSAPPLGSDFPAPAPEPVLHTVQRGDTLYDLAAKYYGPEKAYLYKKILEANRDKIVNENLLKPGMQLLIPSLDAQHAGPAAVATDQNRTYTVKRGDTLSAISQRELGTAHRWREIMTLNGLSSEYNLQVGMVLKLPPVSRPTQSSLPEVPPTPVSENW